MAEGNGSALNGNGMVAAVRIVQMVVLPILLTLSWWMFTTINDIQSRVVRLEENVKAGIDDRYRRRDSVADFALRDREIEDLRDRIKVLEQKQR